jgi:hypothetical protein
VSADSKVEHATDPAADAVSTGASNAKDWTAGGSMADSALPPTSAEEAELLQSLDTIVQQASQGTGDFPSVTAPLNPPLVGPDASDGPQSIPGTEGSVEPGPERSKVEQAWDPDLIGSPEEWTALASINALDGDAVDALAQWFQVAKPEECEVYSRRIRLGHALLYALEQASPPAQLRATLAQELGKQDPILGRLYPSKRVALSMRLAQTLGWSQSQFLKVILVAVVLLCLAGWSLVLRGAYRVRQMEAQVLQAEQRLKKSEASLTLSQERLAFAASADLRISDLQSGEPHGKQTAHLLWSPYGRKGLLWVRDFEVAPQGKEYALWVLSGSRQFPAAKFSEAPGGQGLFIDVPALQEGRPRPIEAFTLVLQPSQAMDPADGIKLLSGNAYRH